MLAFLLLLSLGVDASKKCRAIALEGGGSHGAYESGCMSELVSLLDAEEVRWDVVTGISTGALNAGGVAQFATGDEKAMVEFIEYIWTHLNGSSSVYKNWVGGVVQGILAKPGLYDTSPLNNTLHTFYNKGFHRTISVGSTNLNTGFFANFNESLGDELIEGVLCSASPPFFFPYQYFQNSIWADGGCIINLDVFRAVERCLEVVDKQDDIIVDMIYDMNGELAVDSHDLNTINVIARARNIRNYDKSVHYTYNAKIAYPNVDFRYIIRPSKVLPGGYVPLDFDQKVLEDEIATAKSDTQKIVQDSKTGGERIIEEFNRRKSLVFYIKE